MTAQANDPARADEGPALRLGIELILHLPPDLLAVPPARRETLALPRHFLEQKDAFVLRAAQLEAALRASTPPWEDVEAKVSAFYARLQDRLVAVSRAERAVTGETWRDLSPDALLAEDPPPAPGPRLVEAG